MARKRNPRDVILARRAAFVASALRSVALAGVVGGAGVASAQPKEGADDVPPGDGVEEPPEPEAAVPHVCLSFDPGPDDRLGDPPPPPEHPPQVCLSPPYRPPPRRGIRIGLAAGPELQAGIDSADSLFGGAAASVYANFSADRELDVRFGLVGVAAFAPSGYSIAAGSYLDLLINPEREFFFGGSLGGGYRYVGGREAPPGDAYTVVSSPYFQPAMLFGLRFDEVEIGVRNGVLLGGAESNSASRVGVTYTGGLWLSYLFLPD